MSEKLTENVLFRATKDTKEQLEHLAKDYGTNPAEVIRRILSEAIKSWHVPGFTKRHRPPK